MDDSSVPVVSLQPQPHCLPDSFNRGNATDAEHSPNTIGGILHEGAQGDHTAEANSGQPRTIWSDHHQCHTHTPARGNGHIQLVWGLNRPFFAAPTTHPYRSSASLIYNPRDRPNANDAVSAALDSGPGATVTSAQGTDTGGGDDRSHDASWSSGFKPTTGDNDYSKREDYLQGPGDSFSASSSPAPSRSAVGPGSSEGEPAATDLSSSADAAPEPAQANANPDKGGAVAELIRPHVPPNISIGFLQDFIPGVKRIHDSNSASHRVQRSPTGCSGLAKPAKLKSTLKRDVSLDSTISDSDHDDNLIIDEYLNDFPLDDNPVSPTKDFTDLETLLSPDNLDIDIAPSLLIPTQPKYFQVSPPPPYFIALRPTKEQKYPIQNICTLGPGHNRAIETTVKVTERIIQRVVTPGIQKTSDDPFAKPSKEPTVLTATYPNLPNFKVAMVDPILSFPCLKNLQVYPAEQAAQLMADSTTITELGKLNECETYRWDVIFTASDHQLDRLSLTTDLHSGKRYINLLTGDHIHRWQIVTPHDNASTAAHSPFTWNTHIYFARSKQPSYVQSYQLN